jgi:hypothetical protein
MTTTCQAWDTNSERFPFLDIGGIAVWMSCVSWVYSKTYRHPCQQKYTHRHPTNVPDSGLPQVCAIKGRSGKGRVNWNDEENREHLSRTVNARETESLEQGIRSARSRNYSKGDCRGFGEARRREENLILHFLHLPTLRWKNPRDNLPFFKKFAGGVSRENMILEFLPPETRSSRGTLV